MTLLKIISRIFRGKNVNRDVPYGDDPAMSYDEFPSADKKAPVVIFWHGGGWEKGDKSCYGYVGTYFQKIGCNTIIADYPKYPDQTFPGFIKDSRSLLDVIRKKYPKSKIYLSGHSSGAHTALITAMKLRERPVDGVIALSTPNGFETHHWPRWKHVFTDSFESKKQDIWKYVDNSPRVTKYLLLHGNKDTTVQPKHSKHLHQVLLVDNRLSKYKLINLIDHMSILSIFIPGFLPSAKREIKKFIDV